MVDYTLCLEFRRLERRLNLPISKQRDKTQCLTFGFHSVTAGSGWSKRRAKHTW